MAILIDKMNRRVYNPNARGAVTTIVNMRADNPFESERIQVTRPAMSMRGKLAGLGEGEAPAAEASTGIDWAALAQSGATIGAGVVQKLISPQPSQAPRVVIQPAPGMSTTTKVLIVGGIAAVGVIAMVLMKKS